MEPINSSIVNNPFRYVGSSLDGAGAPNFTRTELDTATFSSPVEHSGDEGEGVFLPSRDKIRSGRLWHLHKFNVVASDRIPINRTLKDVRSEACKRREYDISELPDTSVVIVFHNEAWWEGGTASVLSLESSSMLSCS